MKPGTEVGLGPGHMLDVDPAPNLQPVFCGQTVGWIKMPLGTKVGIGPGDVVLDGDPAARPKRGTVHVRHMSIVAKRLYG